MVVEAPAEDPTLATGEAPPTMAFRASQLPASPLTELASRIREIVIAALQGRPLPQSPIAIEPVRNESRLVRLKTVAPNVRDLDFFFFAMEVEIAYSQPDRRTDDEEAGDSIKAIAFLGRTGLRVAELRRRGSARVQTLPPWLSGAEAFGRSLHSALREKRIEPMLIGEADRSAVGNDLLFDKLTEDRPRGKTLDELTQLAMAHRAPTGFYVDDLILAARDRTGGIWGFQLNVDERDGQLMLDSSPLVKVEKFEPEKQRRHYEEMPPPPPPAVPPP